MRVLNPLLIAGGLLGMFADVHAGSCMDNAKTQLDLNLCAGSSFKQADKELNELYRKILAEYADDPKFINNFKAAQRAWLRFRDAEMEALFPHSNEDRYYGSVYPMCNSTWLATLTKERIAQLKKWTNRAEEGDVCSGSIKTKE